MEKNFKIGLEEINRKIEELKSESSSLGLLCSSAYYHAISEILLNQIKADLKSRYFNSVNFKSQNTDEIKKILHQLKNQFELHISSYENILKNELINPPTPKNFLSQFESKAKVIIKNIHNENEIAKSFSETESKDITKISIKIGFIGLILTAIGIIISMTSGSDKEQSNQQKPKWESTQDGAVLQDSIPI